MNSEFLGGLFTAAANTIQNMINVLSLKFSDSLFKRDDLGCPFADADRRRIIDVNCLALGNGKQSFDQIL